LPILPAVFFAALLIHLFFSENKKYDWNKSYRPQSYRPYGAKVAEDLLEKPLGAEGWSFKTIVRIRLFSGRNRHLACLGKRLGLDLLRNLQWRAFLVRGNRAFLPRDSLLKIPFRGSREALAFSPYPGKRGFHSAHLKMPPFLRSRAIRF